MFLAAITAEAKIAFAPLLNEEHSAWRWFPLAQAFHKGDLHPVVRKVFKKKPQKMVRVRSCISEERSWFWMPT